MELLHADEPQWKHAFVEALVEAEPELLTSKLRKAETAIEKRLLELGSQRGEHRSQEVHELTDARRLLRYLSKDEPQF
jgi:hypothetical protein